MHHALCKILSRKVRFSFSERSQLTFERYCHTLHNSYSNFTMVPWSMNFSKLLLNQKSTNSKQTRVWSINKYFSKQNFSESDCRSKFLKLTVRSMQIEPILLNLCLDKWPVNITGKMKSWLISQIPSQARHCLMTCHYFQQLLGINWEREGLKTKKP